MARIKKNTDRIVKKVEPVITEEVKPTEEIAEIVDEKVEEPINVYNPEFVNEEVAEPIMTQEELIEKIEEVIEETEKVDEKKTIKSIVNNNNYTFGYEWNGMSFE